jgi:hypothetical protein
MRFEELAGRLGFQPGNKAGRENLTNTSRNWSRGTGMGHNFCVEWSQSARKRRIRMA